MAIVECVPNFSEGRRREVVEAIAAEVRAIPDVKLLDIQMDPDHNRSVLTFVGEPEAAEMAAFKAAAKAAELIDMNKHRGEHPRIGATDVIPFVPISGVTMQDCVALAYRLGEELWRRLGIPVYFYAEAAKRPDRVSLPEIREGEYEGLKAGITTNPDRRPDVGEPRLHPTAGATVVGARGPLIAFNVNLATKDVEVAKAIARKIRTSSGGLAAIQAKGFALEDRGLAQVSINLLNFRTTSIPKVFEAIRREAEGAGVTIAGSEVVGLIPLDALMDCAQEYLRLQNFRRDQILETRLWE